MLYNIRLDLLLVDRGVMLGADDHGIDAQRLAVDILHRHLALAVRTQIGQRLILAHL